MKVVCMPLNPTFTWKTGICRGMFIFLTFDPKHRLWVLVRTTTPRWFQLVHVLTINVLSKNMKVIEFFQMDFFFFFFDS